MPAAKGFCFVIMPFRPELRYVYDSIKQFVEKTFELTCERGDDKFLTGPLLDKIRKMIEQADIVIADCSGRNPNVFYELGMAHVLDKPVILITHDPIEAAPTDIKAFEFIHYGVAPKDLLDKLGNAIRGVLGEDFDDLYAATRTAFLRFQQDKGLALQESSKDDFLNAVAGFHPSAPDPDDEEAVAKQLLLSMVGGAIDLDVVTAFKEWTQANFPEDG